MLWRKQNSDRRNNFSELEDGSELVGLMKNKEVSVPRGVEGRGSEKEQGNRSWTGTDFCFE